MMNLGVSHVCLLSSLQRLSLLRACVSNSGENKENIVIFCGNKSIMLMENLQWIILPSRWEFEVWGWRERVGERMQCRKSLPTLDTRDRGVTCALLDFRESSC